MPRRKNSTPPEQLPRSSGRQQEDQPLTEMQRRFVMGLVHDKLNQTAAARQAGFSSPSTGAAQLLLNPKVQKAIAEERREYAIASKITRAKVIEGFMEAINMAKMLADPPSMIAGWREIGKMCGLYEATTTKVELSVNGQLLASSLKTMTDEELLEIVEKENRVLIGEYEVLPEVLPEALTE